MAKETQCKTESQQRGLVKYKKGQSGNPKGRPPTPKCIPDLLRKYGKWQTPESFMAKLRERFPKIPQDLPMEDGMILRVWCEALSGESWATEFIAERTEGKVKEVLEFEDVTQYDVKWDVNVNVKTDTDKSSVATPKSSGSAT